VYAISVYDETETTGVTATLTNPIPVITGAPTVTATFAGVKIDWRNITPADNDGLKFVIYCDTDTPPTTNVGVTDWETRKWYETGLDTDSTYYAQIEPYDGFGVGTKSSVSATFEPLKIATVDIDAELSSSITMSDIDDTTASGLSVLYDRVVDSGGITYGNGDWVNSDFGIELFQEGVRIYASAGANVYVSYRRNITGDSGWHYLGGEGDHTLDTEGAMVSYSTSGAAATNYLTIDSGKNVPKFPQGIIAVECRLHFLSTVTIYEMIFIREVIAEQIVADNLAAISANIGTITAGQLQSPAYPTSGLYIDIDDGTIIGTVTFKSGTTGIANTDAGDLATQDRSDLSYTDGADVTGDNTAAATVLVGTTAAATVESNAAAGETFTSTDAGDLATLDEVDTGQIANDAITNAQIDAGAVKAVSCDTTIIDGGKIITGLLTADNIQTGTLSTGYVKIESTDGKTTMDGNTIIVKDASNVTRIKIGKLN